MPPPVTLAIVSWNTRDLLDACLASLRPDAEAGLADVWVVDNGSTDGSPAMVRERHPWATVEVPGRNLGYGPAVNLAARRTRSRFVAAANADLRFEPGALAALVAAADRHPSAGVLGPRLILPDGSTQPAVQPFPRARDALVRNLSLFKAHRRLGERLALAGYWDPARPAAVDWVTGAFLLVTRTCWDAIGGFDEGRWMYAEDLDLCWRAHQAGFAVRYEPQAVVHHHLSVAAAQAFGDDEERARRMLRATYDWLRLRRGRWIAARVLLAEAATGALRGALLWPLARRGEARAAHARARALRLSRRHWSSRTVLR